MNKNEDEEDYEELNNNKYEFLNAPILLDEFRKNYLSSLNIFLNDQKFKEKTDSLPVLKSSAISKYEKLIQNKLNDVELSFENGYLIFKSNAGFEVATGSSTDTSNFASVTGVTSNGNKVKSAKELYKVNGSVGTTDSNLSRYNWY